jgi:16S rRNA (adenine1518-N6/adenine1519-N6)-dimethyltransferase
VQTKRQIQQLLAWAGVRPNKRLGQHFLIDLNLMRLLLDCAKISPNDVVLEVGCGTGSLTAGLAERAGQVIAVEYDPKLAHIARTQLVDAGNVEIINADVLSGKHTINANVLDGLTAARRQHAGRLLLVANLPYNVASPVMANLVTGPMVADAMYITIQKEVAERMTAKPATKAYGTMSILLQASGDIEVLRRLKPSVFWPAPKVESALVSFVRNPEKLTHIEGLETLVSVVDLFVGHRRKTLKSCANLASRQLSRIKDWPAVFAQSGIDSSLRPEQLSPENYVAMANLCQKMI